MAVNTGPRTHPTVKPLATMNKKNLQHWELRLGLAQVVVLLGMITGSIACAFYVGFSSGRGVGFEAALERSLAHAPRFPVAEAERDIAASRDSDVYARLSAPAGAAVSKVTKEEPVLGAIKTTEALPLGMDSAGELPSAAKEENRSASASLDVDSLFPEPVAKDVEVPKTRSLANIAEENLAATSKVTSKNLEQAKAKEAVVAQVDQTVEKTSSDSSSYARVTVKREEKVAAPKAEKIVTKTPANVASDPKKTSQVAKAEAPKSKVVTAAAVKSPEKSLVRETLPAGWFAQVAAPRKMQDATSLAGRLKASGFPVIIEAARVRGEEYFRVIVGPEQNKQQAERLVSQLKRESYVQGEPFLRVAK